MKWKINKNNAPVIGDKKTELSCLFKIGELFIEHTRLNDFEEIEDEIMEFAYSDSDAIEIEYFSKKLKSLKPLYDINTLARIITIVTMLKLPINCKRLNQI